MEILQSPSPNFDDRPGGREIDMLVLHYTGMKTGDEAFERLCDPVAKVSAHYLVEEDGRILQMVADDKRAWHAGISHWAGEEALNGCSIGIEIVNPGHEWGYRDFPNKQMNSVISLAESLMKRYNISNRRIVGHSDIAPTRKQDPGELFNWQLLAENNVGLWCIATSIEKLDSLCQDQTGENISFFQSQLVKLGYGLPETGVYDLETVAVVKAFQRHWVPRNVTGQACALTQATLETLLSTKE